MNLTFGYEVTSKGTRYFRNTSELVFGDAAYAKKKAGVIASLKKVIADTRATKHGGDLKVEVFVVDDEGARSTVGTLNVNGDGLQALELHGFVMTQLWSLDRGRQKS